MKAILATLGHNLISDKLFVIKEINLPAFSTEFHFHKECQLVHVVESAGRRIIGDNVEYFESGELVFVGSNVPHVWYNEASYFGNKKQLQARSMVINIEPSLLKECFSLFGNLSQLESWMHTAQRSIQFYGPCKDNIVTLMKRMLTEQGIRQSSSFMELIVLLTEAKEHRLLTSKNYENLFKDKDQTRMEAVFKHIFRHFRREIPLTEIAAVASMNTYSFCRFFKSRTQQSFVDFVNELRISYACRLIQEKEMNMSELASMAGFNHTTHFNRLFKRKKGLTPKEYRKSLQLPG
ncbi:AraC family transcriptional regulator [Chitinophaga qingshengii]|uniref:Helix-turn-helix transcriptional regulator n=1 Tax=Chitinophaga qingshengii TaxID=1569794 RepID=A0ABR7TU34_9BACT|nr:AraC family transcriptional regulator [Chitinophaga qingshengii]MBC9933528.1 helix-turn-helix transcriptional regulator [Chitinophaga qingshengii]